VWTDADERDVRKIDIQPILTLDDEAKKYGYELALVEHMKQTERDELDRLFTRQNSRDPTYAKLPTLSSLSVSSSSSAAAAGASPNVATHRSSSLPMHLQLPPIRPPLAPIGGGRSPHGKQQQQLSLSKSAINISKAAKKRLAAEDTHDDLDVPRPATPPKHRGSPTHKTMTSGEAKDSAATGRLPTLPQNLFDVPDSPIRSPSVSRRGAGGRARSTSRRRRRHDDGGSASPQADTDAPRRHSRRR
jgi:hypothetical protein